MEEPAFSFAGIVSPEPDESGLEFGLLWIDPAQQASANAASGSDLVRAQMSAEGYFTIDLLGPPPAGMIRRMSTSADGGAEFAFAWAEIVMYQDRDGDRRFRVGALADGSPIVPPDVYRGVSASHVVLYVEQPLAPSKVLSWELDDFIKKGGYQLGSVLCNTRPSIRAFHPPRDVIVSWLEPSATVPEHRTCLRSQPDTP